MGALGIMPRHTRYIKLDYDQWVEQFKPIPNHFLCNFEIDECEHEEEPEFRYDTFGEEKEFVRMFTDRNRIWTLISAGENMKIIEGWHLCDREAYYITLVPFEPDTAYEISC
jgi:hypothetical protein